MCPPKGHVDPGETAQQAATREVLEETGLSTEFLQKLDDVKYVYRFGGKTIFKVVSFFLFRWAGGEIDAITPEMRNEVTRAYWLPLYEATGRLTYPGERNMVQLAQELLKTWKP